MEFLHTMVRVTNVEDSLKFYCDGLGLREIRRSESEAGRFTLVFLATDADIGRAGLELPIEGRLPAGLPMIELTYNWDPEDYKSGRNFGHLAYRVDNIYHKYAHLQALGYTIKRPPCDGRMAFVKSPDGISIEVLQKGEPGAH